MEIKQMRTFKDKRHRFSLTLKIALICFVTMFGINYMSSDTSAYLSSQSEVTQIITAGIWEIPVDPAPDVLGQCDEESKVEPEDKDQKSNLENDKEAVASEEIQVDCDDIDGEPKVEDEKATDQENEEKKELENVEDKTDLDVDTEKEQGTSVDVVETKPNAPDEGNKSNEQKSDEKKSVESKAPEVSSEKKIDEELNAIVKPEENTKEAEGDSNEEKENNEVDK